MTIKITTNCLICKLELVYSNETKEKLNCHFCGRKVNTNVKCKSGHYVCDYCHSLPANQIIIDYCTVSMKTDPIEMAEDLFADTRINMHGPEHHFLVPAVLLTSFYNTRNEFEVKFSKLMEAQKRAIKIIGGFCGYYGACGAAIGSGIFLSIITDTTPMSKESWSLSNLSTSESLRKIALSGGPRCCKRDSYIAICSSVEFIKRELDTNLPLKENICCEYHKLNINCLGKKCQFFGN